MNILNYFRTVDGIIQDFTDKIEQLNDLAGHYLEGAASAKKQAAYFEAKSERLTSESHRAVAIATKINNLLGE